MTRNTEHIRTIRFGEPRRQTFDDFIYIQVGIDFKKYLLYIAIPGPFSMFVEVVEYGL